ncbi:TonB-dependent receptor plug domain-containing protein [Derxia gummosa]|uniref:TonB-dependent receptor plug domain-containing protein n=1 Tax=Derxia gummosa DSM 723 TaxID=1121388 RepID=A0A8B6X9T7_9BURK|nr:TonB-dependent receptor [Derxia gummosa]
MPLPTALHARPARLPLTIALGLAALAPAFAQQAPDPAARPAQPANGVSLDAVEIRSRGPAETAERRYATAPKSVVTRDEILQFGDSNLGDALKRLPGVTLGGPPGRPGGEVRMRGLGSGYTQILLNGERVPPGFSIDTLAPEQVERIEVMKAPTAEHGTRAIGGTINIVLREPLGALGDEVKLETGVERGRPSERASFGRTGGFGDGHRYSLNAGVFHADQLTETETRTRATADATGTPLLDRDEVSRSLGRREGVQAGGRVQFRLDGGDQLVLSPFLFAMRGRSDTDSQLAQTVGTAPYASSHTDADNSDAAARLSGQWQHRLNDSGARLQLDLSAGGSENRGTSDRSEYAADGTRSRTLDASNRSQDRSINSKGKLSQPLDGGHSLVAGWEWEDAWRHQRRVSLDNGVSQLAGYGDSTRARSRTLAGWAQDEWEIDLNWSAYAGLRWEQIATQSRTAGSSSDNSSAVWSPLFHVAWKPDENARDVVRLSLTRSYKAPQLGQLSNLPVLSTRPNDPSNPDSVGNPDLKPELATGIDLAWEHYTGRRSVTSIGVFQRRITDLIRTVTSLQPVPWAASDRWVSRPENVGDAVTRGIELEARTGFDEIVAGAPAINLKAGLSLYRSQVDGIPGPNNRLDQQPKAQGSFSLDGRVPGTPLTLGGGVTWTPVTTIQLTPTQQAVNGTKIVADVFGAWAFSPVSQLRLSVANLSGRDYDSGGSVVSATQGFTQTTATTQRTNPVATLRWELRI